VTDQLLAIIPPGALTTPDDTYIVPALIADAGDAAGWRHIAVRPLCQKTVDIAQRHHQRGFSTYKITRDNSRAVWTAAAC
jgi:hypothetical protein